MSFFEPENLRQITAGRFLRRPPAESSAPMPQGVSTDTRTLRPGQIFLALRGENFNGHDYLAQAFDAGAPLLIIDDEAAASDLPDKGYVLLVDNTAAALTALAAAYRKTLPGRIIAITGSVGKTTTKRMLDAVLSVKHAGRASPKSFNNHIGVPLTLLNSLPSDAYVICEVGTNAPGEIAALSRIVSPDIAIITAVGVAHLEGLGSVEAVLREKSSMLSHLREGGVAIVNGDVTGLRDYRRVVSALITYGQSDTCDLRLTDYHAATDGAEFQVNNRWRYTLPLLGEHNALNALAVLAVARHMQLTEAQIVEGLSRIAAPDGRLNRVQVGSITVIDDSYNANPDSMAAALNVLASHPTSGRRIAILGDMLELGEQGPAYHRTLGETVLESDCDMVVFIGRLSLFAAQVVSKKWSADRVHAVATFDDDTPQHIADLLQRGDTVLLKASRGSALERLMPAIQHRFNNHQTSRASTS